MDVVADPAPGAAVTQLVRVTVSAGERRVDLAVPDSVPVAELLPSLVRAVGLADADPVGDGCRFATLEGRLLLPDATLRDQGVVHGSWLVAVTGADPLTTRVHDDPVEALADAVDRELDPWTTDATRRVTLAAAGLLLGLGPVLVLLAGPGALSGASAAAGAVLLAVAGVRAARDRASYGVGLALLSVPYAASAGLLLAPALAPGDGAALALAGSAAAATGALVARLPSGRPSGLGVVGAGAAVALGGTAQQLWLPDLLVVAPALLAVVALAGTMAPWLLAGPATEEVGAGQVAQRVRRAHTGLQALSVATGILLVLLVPPTVGRGPAGVALGVTASVAVLLRARHHRVATEVLVDLVSGVAGLLVTAGTVAVLLPGWRPLVGLALLLAGLAVLAGSLLPVGSPLHRARAADVAESVTLLALLPLMVVAAGLLDRVVG